MHFVTHSFLFLFCFTIGKVRFSPFAKNIRLQPNFLSSAFFVCYHAEVLSAASGSWLAWWWYWWWWWWCDRRWGVTGIAFINTVTQVRRILRSFRLSRQTLSNQQCRSSKPLRYTSLNWTWWWMNETGSAVMLWARMPVRWTDYRREWIN